MEGAYPPSHLSPPWAAGLAPDGEGAPRPPGRDWKKLVIDSLAVLPGTGEAISAFESAQSGQRAKDAFDQRRYGEAAGEAILSALAGAGAIPVVGGAIRGVKPNRLRALWHGADDPASAKDIVKHGFKRGESAEINLQGTSTSRDPYVSGRFAGGDTSRLLRVSSDVDPKTVRNLRPSEYATNDLAVTGRYDPEKLRHVPEPVVSKPGHRFQESEIFFTRPKEGVPPLKAQPASKDDIRHIYRPMSSHAKGQQRTRVLATGPDQYFLDDVTRARMDNLAEAHRKIDKLDRRVRKYGNLGLNDDLPLATELDTAYRQFIRQRDQLFDKHIPQSVARKPLTDFYADAKDAFITHGRSGGVHYQNTTPYELKKAWEAGEKKRAIRDLERLIKLRMGYSRIPDDR